MWNASAPHVRSLCKKAIQKLNACAKIVCSLKIDQKKLLNAFITSQFSLVVWMFHYRKLNINLIHERAWRIVYQNHNSKLEELLTKDSFSKFMTVVADITYWNIKMKLTLKWS